MNANNDQNKDLPWKTVDQFNNDIDSLPHGPDWHCRTIRVEGDNGTEVLDLWMRDVVEVIKMLIGDPRFAEHIRYAPEKHFTSATHETRVYDEMWSADWWWRIQVSIEHSIKNLTYEIPDY
jgi:hypothetical protein